MELKQVCEKLARNRFDARCFANKEAAADYLEQAIQNKIVGFGDSGTLMAMDLYERLCMRNCVYSPMHRGERPFEEMAQAAMNTQIFLTSVNAMSETGELVNIDGRGNRVAGSLFGHERIYFVVGKNKIEPTLEKAIWRARNIAAPQNAKRLGLKTPCAVKGDRCYNCSSPDRICNGLVVHYKQMYCCNMEVVLIDEELGL